MGPKLPRFRLRTLLFAIALLAFLLGVGIWYFTPRISLRLVPVQTSWTVDDFPLGLVEFTNRAPRGLTLSFLASSIIGLDLIVTDASGRVVSEAPYWFYDSPVTSEPRTDVLGLGATYLHPVRLLRTLPHWEPGTYTVEAVYDLGDVLARSNKVTIQLLPRPSP